MTLIHLALLHKEGSNNPIGSDTGIDDIPFYPYFVSKDIFALSCFLVFFATFVFYFPNTLNHPDNYICADPLETPAHVVPEWYFLPYYAILRSIPQCEYAPYVDTRGLFCTLVSEISVIHPIGAVSNNSWIMPFETRLGNLDSLSYRDLLLRLCRVVAVILRVSSTCVDTNT